MKAWNWKKVVGIFLGLFLFISFFPLRNIIFSSFLWEKHLLVLTNEAEARPCGGFVTAFGELRLFPPKIWLKNSYAMTPFNFGENNGVLKEVALEKKFWDLGDSIDLEECVTAFREAYNSSLQEDVQSVVLVNFSVLSDFLEILGDFSFQGKQITGENVFGVISRLVADVDRHDEGVLEERKSVLKPIAQKIIWKIVVHPHKWLAVSQVIRENIQGGDIYISGFSEEYKPNINSFGVIEWNLGGGKSSRFLQKELTLSAREKTPAHWEIDGVFDVEHLGGQDEPVSQTWTGGFEFLIPEILGEDVDFQGVEIKPGEKYKYEFNYLYDGDLKALNIFRPRGQTMNTDVRLSVYPQQYLTNSNLEIKDNIGYWFGPLVSANTSWQWETIQDQESPFLTLHKKVATKKLTENFVVEVHFNEPIKKLANFSATLKDRNYTNTEINEDLILQSHQLLEDNTTLLLGFNQSVSQPKERFYLEIEGIEDWLGNKFITKQNTVIDR